MGGKITPSPPPSPAFWFSLNNSEALKAVTLKAVTFYWRHLCKFGITNLPQSPNIGENSDGAISGLWISNQSVIKKIVITPEPAMILT